MDTDEKMTPLEDLDKIYYYFKLTNRTRASL